MPDPTLSDIDLKIKMTWIWTTLKNNTENAKVAIHVTDESEKEVSDSGSYRPGYTLVRGTLQPGKYVFKVSTFYPEKIGKYFFDFSSSNPVTFL